MEDLLRNHHPAASSPWSLDARRASSVGSATCYAPKCGRCREKDGEGRGAPKVDWRVGDLRLWEENITEDDIGRNKGV